MEDQLSGEGKQVLSGQSISPILSCLEEVVHREQRASEELVKARELWNTFLEQNHPAMQISGNPRIWSAALHYYTVLLLMDVDLTQKVIGKYYKVSPASVSKRVKILRESLDQITIPAPRSRTKVPKQRRKGISKPSKPILSREKLLALARQMFPLPRQEPLQEGHLVEVFQQTHRLLSALYPAKTHIEILHYLQHVEWNLRFAGYDISPLVLQTMFAKLFPRLGLQVVKGRDAKKFVYVEDIYGRREPFVLVKLGGDDV